jgi:glutathione S-transferase kappa 1
MRLGTLSIQLSIVIPTVANQNSYMGLSYLLKNKDLLASHDVTIEYILSNIPVSIGVLIHPRFHPIFLGGVNVGSGKFLPMLPTPLSIISLLTGNKPPWTLPAQQKQITGNSM